MTFGSLFTGIGGLDLGLERAGLICRWQVEIDPYCSKVLTKHWPGVKRYGDIRTLTGDELEPVGLICGGFPCQDLSQAGKRAGIEGTRSGLWFEFARLVGRLGPRWVLIENVPGLLVHDAMRRVVGELARLGYVGLWRSLRAAEFGASHLRKRVFIVAYRTSGGLGERREPSGCNRFVDGRNTALADAGSSIRRETERIVGAEVLDKRRWNPASSIARANDATLANTECAEWRQNQQYQQLPERRQQTPGRLGSDHRHLAHSGWPGNGWAAEPAGFDRRRPSDHDRGASGTLADAWNRQLPDPWRRPQPGDGPGPTGAVFPDNELADTAIAGLEERRHQTGNCREASGFATAERTGYEIPRFAPGPADPRWPAILTERPDLAPALESAVRRMADGLPDWLDRAMNNRTKRLGRLGNAVVPDCAEWIGSQILEFEGRT